MTSATSVTSNQPFDSKSLSIRLFPGSVTDTSGAGIEANESSADSLYKVDLRGKNVSGWMIHVNEQSFLFSELLSDILQSVRSGCTEHVELVLLISAAIEYDLDTVFHPFVPVNCRIHLALRWFKRNFKRQLAEAAPTSAAMN